MNIVFSSQYLYETLRRAVLLVVIAGPMIACGQPDVPNTGTAPTSFVAYPMLDERTEVVTTRLMPTSQLKSETYPPPLRNETATPIPSDQPTPLRNEDGNVSKVPTATELLPPPDADMYTSVLSQFFADNQVQNIIQTPYLTQTVITIQPEISAHFPASLVDTIGTMILQQPSLGVFTHVAEPQPGGLLVSYGEPKRDEGARAVYGSASPTIFVAIQVVGNDCGGFIAYSYLLQPTNHGWSAQLYLTAVC